MKLYAIKRKSDGKFYRIQNWNYFLNAGVSLDRATEFSVKPAALYRTPDGVVRNLRKLCSVPYWDETPPKGVCSAVAQGWREVGWRDFNPKLLALYSISILEVAVSSTSDVECEQFCTVEDVAGAPLSSREKG